MSESKEIAIQGTNIQVTWEAGVSEENINMLVSSHKPFTDWIAAMNRNAEHMQVQQINVQSIDRFGKHIGFVKFKATVVNKGKTVPGIVFMRGGTAGVLVVLKLQDERDSENGKEFTILTVQPRVPVGEYAFPEIPAGMLDGDGNCQKIAVKELYEETSIDAKTLTDLTQFAYGDTYKGMYPSAGGCDEVIRLFLYRANVTRAKLNSYQGKSTGVLKEGEAITLKVIPLEMLWKETPDSKALAALYLYNVYNAENAQKNEKPITQP